MERGTSQNGCILMPIPSTMVVQCTALDSHLKLATTVGVGRVSSACAAFLFLFSSYATTVQESVPLKMPLGI
eukprot:scaffold74967_cov16-Tisochrysis_lutea.AAC.1